MIMKLEMHGKQILLDGSPFRILSGEMHYFRIPREYWRDRLEKLRACGLNTVATYMPWNLHEPEPGQFDFSGGLDVAAFIKLVGELDLQVIIRPGPYICSEWEFGGFPAWLLRDRQLRLRSAEPHYLACIKRYYEAVIEEIRPFYNRNLTMFQIENGYASYGNDQKYYRFLKKLVDDSGFPGIVIAADGDSDTRISTEVPAGVWRTLMCGSENPIEQLEFMKQEQPDKPQFVIEYWNGQELLTGVPVRLRDPAEIIDGIEKILAWGAHLNLYMFHGGTNFGLMNGGHEPAGSKYIPMSSSYDTFAPLTEAGDITGLYLKMRKIFSKYNPAFDSAKTLVPGNLPKTAFGEVELTECAMLADNLDELSEHSVKSSCPLTMEDAGGDYGYVRYTTKLSSQHFLLPVSLYDYQDGGWAFYNGHLISAFERKNAEFTVDTGNGGTLELVIENAGRTNFFYTMEHNRKGISGGVLLNHQQFQQGWTTSTLSMKDLSKLKFHPLSGKSPHSGPAFFRGEFTVEDPADTFLTIPSGQRGFCAINGFLLGRYDHLGPIYTLYVPKSLLRKGKNSITVFEKEFMVRQTVEFLNRSLQPPRLDLSSDGTPLEFGNRKFI